MLACEYAYGALIAGVESIPQPENAANAKVKNRQESGRSFALVF